MDCNGKYCRMAQDAARKLPPAQATYLIRAAHERYCLDHAAGIVATTCKECLGVLPGHAAGTQEAPAQRDSQGRYVQGSRLRYKECTCHTSDLGYNDLVALHGLTGVLRGDTVPSTGKAQD